MKAKSGNAPSTPARLPGRHYGLIVTALAVFLLGLAIEAIRGSQKSEPAAATAGETVPVATLSPDGFVAAASDPSTPTGDATSTTPALSRGQLGFWVLTALGFGTVSLLAPRHALPKPESSPPTLLAELTGRPVLGQIFPVEPKPAETATPASGRWLRFVVICSELVIAVSVCVAIYSIATQPESLAEFRQNPLLAFMEAIRHAQQQATALFRAIS
jgi:hypothetical protein